MNAVKVIKAVSPYVICLKNSQKITTEEGSLWCHAILTVTNYTNNPALISRYSAITPVENMSCPVLLIYETVYLIYNSEFQVKLIFARLK